MPYNVKQLGEKSVSIDFFIADPILLNCLLVVLNVAELLQALADLYSGFFCSILYFH